MYFFKHFIKLKKATSGRKSWIKIRNKRLPNKVDVTCGCDLSTSTINLIKIPFFHFSFLKRDFLFTIMSLTLKLDDLADILFIWRGPCFDLGPTSYFMSKKGKTFYHLLQLNVRLRG